ncbi:glycogen debranching protein GlgX [Yimella sp. cx-573]|nr:glycogen debranching protein GlgX [Yimella sp. cx-573]
MTAAAPRSLDAPPAPGVLLRADGAEFTIVADRADRVRLCLFDASGSERQIDLVRHRGGTWSGFVDGVGPGQRYGYRVDGPWAPKLGHRYNPNKLILDPYGYAIDGEVHWNPTIFGHTVDAGFSGDGSTMDERDSAPDMPRNVVIDTDFDWAGDEHPHTPWDRTLIYEAHVRGMTMSNPELPEHLRGTYAGMAHPATIAHLQTLGVTAVELLPVHAFTSEPHLVKLDLSNYWGYNTLGFFAPHAAYAAASDPQGVIDEFKGMVKLLHRAGIEVILDVVYNHTSEQGAETGATLSWRGAEACDYYRLGADGRDFDVTGCGNTIDTTHPTSLRMVLDSLRYWVSEIHVDGFRFDLAVALGRDQEHAFRADHPLLLAMRTDPVLSRTKLISEPWDVGPHGWRTGQFPAPMADWNDKFRDAVRTFWLRDLAADTVGQSGHGVAELATRIAGSPDVFGDRSPMASVNYVTAHDGFPLADLTTYNVKHNDANGEHNRDGSDHNLSWNFGVEGREGASPELLDLRRRVVRNMLATLLLSSGVPMLLGGDEFGRTQGGNNNAYCQDNEISWFDWSFEPWQRDLLATTQFLSGLRAAHPVLRQRSFFPGSPVDGDELAALHWHGIDGAILTADQWSSGSTRTVQAVFDGADVGDDQVLIVLHGSDTAQPVTLPSSGAAEAWNLVWDSAVDDPAEVPSTVVAGGDTYPMRAASMAVFTAPSH